MSYVELDDGDADLVDVPDAPADSGCDLLIEDVFDHLGRTINDDAGWDTEDGS